MPFVPGSTAGKTGTVAPEMTQGVGVKCLSAQNTDTAIVVMVTIADFAASFAGTVAPVVVRRFLGLTTWSLALAGASPFMKSNRA
ncbi:MAG: hypothetical protein NTW50_04925 [Candidatus Berkelbacteria bacterium]|nr:hypothetical protein [Candidatus Berkelbacteria bacterium]